MHTPYRERERERERERGGERERERRPSLISLIVFVEVKHQ